MTGIQTNCDSSHEQVHLKAPQPVSGNGGQKLTAVVHCDASRGHRRLKLVRKARAASAILL
jgi:hypothetical protein